MGMVLVNGKWTYIAPKLSTTQQATMDKLLGNNSTSTSTSTSASSVSVISNLQSTVAAKRSSLMNNINRARSGNGQSMDYGEYLNRLNNGSLPSSPSSRSGNTVTTTTSYFDVDAALQDVYNQARTYGVTLARPKSYGNQITDKAQAQKIVDEYLAIANNAIAKNAQKTTSNSSKKTSANTQAAVSKANKSASAAQPQTVVAPTRGYYDGLTAAQKAKVDEYNDTNSRGGINRQVNPDFVLWRDFSDMRGSEPPYYWDQAQAETAAQKAVRDKAAADEQARLAAIQKDLQASYDATQKAAGTTHAKGTKAVTNNGKSASQIYNEQKGVKPITTKLQVVSSKSVAPSVEPKPVVSQRTTKELMKINSQVKQSNQKLAVIKSNVEAKPLTKGNSAVAKANRATIATANKTGQSTTLNSKTGKLELVASPKQSITSSNGKSNGFDMFNKFNGIVQVNNGVATIYTDPTTTDTFKGAVPFRTNDQIKWGKIAEADKARQDKLIARGGVGGWLVKKDQEFRSAMNYKTVTSQISNKLDVADTKLSKYVPTSDQIVQTRKNALDTIGGKGTTKKLDDIIASNSKFQDISNWEANGYDYIKSHPARTAVSAAEIYAESAIGGAVLKGASLVAGGAAAKVLAPIAARSATIAKIAPTVTKVASATPGIAVVAQTGKTVWVDTKGLSDVEKDLDYMVMFGIGAKGFTKGARAVETRNPTELIPGMKSIDLKEVAPGASGNTRNLHQGTQLEIAGKVLVSSDKSGLHIGQVKASKESLGNYVNVDAINQGKTGKDVRVTRSVQAFDKSSTKVLDKHVLDIMNDVDKVYYSAGKNVATAAYGARKAIVKPNSFSILSTDVPEALRSTLTDAIKSYGKGSGIKNTINRLKGGVDYKIQVAGSNAQKLQMGDYLTRNPGDLEIYTDNPTKFTDKFIESAKKNGFKEDTDFKIENKGTNEPKISFKNNGKWEKGVEIFNHNSKSSTPDTLDIQEEYKQGWKKQEGIAYGFKELKSLVVDNVKIQKLQEQSARKYAGSSFIKGGDTVEVAHPGRVKDVRDLIEIGVANKIVRNVGKTQDVIDYIKAATTKYPEILDPASKKMYSPVAEYVMKNGKLPGKPDVAKLSAKSSALIEKEILYEASNKNLPETLRNVINKSKSIEQTASTLSSRSMSEFSPLPSTRSIAAGERIFGGANREISSRSTHSTRSNRNMSSANTRSMPSTNTKSVSIFNRSSPIASSRTSARSSPSIPSILKDVVRESSRVSRLASDRSLGGIEQRPSNVASTPIKGTIAIGSGQYRNPIKNISTGNIPSKGSISTSPLSPSPTTPKIPSSTPSPKSNSYPSISTQLNKISTTNTKSPSDSSSTPSSGSQSSNSWRGMYLKRTKEQVANAKKKKKQPIEVKKAMDIAKMKRTIHNTLGGLETMFGEESVQKSSRKSNKRVRK